MNLAIGCDHAGLNLKNHLLNWLIRQGHEVRDYGTDTTDSIDYPDIAFQVAQTVAQGTHEKGILVCGAGIGVAIAANKVTGIRAFNCYDALSATLSREHNDTNIITFGERLITPLIAETCLKIWLETPFAGGRHLTRVMKLNPNV